MNCAQAELFENFVRVDAQFTRHCHYPEQWADTDGALSLAGPTPLFRPVVSGVLHSFTLKELLSGFGKILSFSVKFLKGTMFIVINPLV